MLFQFARLVIIGCVDQSEDMLLVGLLSEDVLSEGVLSVGLLTNQRLDIRCCIIRS